MLCLCAKPVVKKTARMENANKGRTFWSCPVRMGEGCGFFEWTDDAPKNWLTMAHEKKARTDNAGCHCKPGPARRQSTRENVNKGRWYLSCTPCDFFQWDSPVVEQPAAGTEAKKEKDEKEEPTASPETGYSIDSPGYNFYTAHPTIQYNRVMCAATEEQGDKDEGMHAVPISESTAPGSPQHNTPYFSHCVIHAGCWFMKIFLWATRHVMSA